MKPLFFTIIFYCFFINTAKAQLDKGYWLTGGDASFISNSNSPHTSTTQKSNSTEIAPTIGYFFFDKFSAGIKFDLLFEHSSIDSTLNGQRMASNYSSYEFGPYVRYYFLNEDKVVNFFAEANYEYGITRIKNSGLPQPSNGQQVTFMAGPVFFFTQSVALEFTAGYYYSFQNKGNIHTRGVQMGLGFMIHLERAD